MSRVKLRNCYRWR